MPPKTKKGGTGETPKHVDPNRTSARSLTELGAKNNSAFVEALNELKSKIHI